MSTAVRPNRIDDFLDSGWTIAVAARELRLAGAPAVLPLVLATTP